MAVTSTLYGQIGLKLANKEIDWDTDNIKVMLCTSSYVPSQDNHVYKSDVTNEIAATGGYSTGGLLLANKTTSYTAGTNTCKFSADASTWATSTITARYAVIYSATGVDGTSPLIAYIDFGQDFSSTNGNFTITWNTNGIFTMTVA